jgi:hypothetical protein
MNSLYGLQRALINENDHSSYVGQSFTDLRHNLHDSWGRVLTLLKESHAFGSEVIALSEWIGSAPAEGLQDFLKTLSLSLTKLHETAFGLVSDSQKTVDELAKRKPRWSKALRHRGLEPRILLHRRMPGMFSSPTPEGNISENVKGYVIDISNVKVFTPARLRGRSN